MQMQRHNPLAQTEPPKNQPIKVTAPMRVTAAATTSLTVAPRTLTVAPGKPMTAPSSPFGGITVAGIVGPAAKKKGTYYPTIPDEAIRLEAEEVAAIVKFQKDQLDAIEGPLTANKKHLTSLCLEQWFAVNKGLSDPHSSLRIAISQGEVLVAFPARYTAGNPDQVIGILGMDMATNHFEEVFELKIDGSSLPKGAETQQFVNAIVGLFGKFGMPQDALKFSTKLKPKAGFHTLRHTLLSPDQNRDLDAACPIVAQVKTKGRK